MAQMTHLDRRLEWIYRVVLSIHLLFVGYGYWSFLQTYKQLKTPLIPSSTFTTIMFDNPAMNSSALEACFFMVALWLYFLHYRMAGLIVSAISIMIYPLLGIYSLSFFGLA